MTVTVIATLLPHTQATQPTGTQGRSALGHPGWPDFGRTTTLNVAAYCALANGISPSQRTYEPVGEAIETIYGSEGWGFESFRSARLLPGLGRRPTGLKVSERGRIPPLRSSWSMRRPTLELGLPLQPPQGRSRTTPTRADVTQSRGWHQSTSSLAACYLVVVLVAFSSSVGPGWLDPDCATWITAAS